MDSDDIISTKQLLLKYLIQITIDQDLIYK